ncbi:MAG: hypothetical protein V4558_03895 [Gemmatimonadota bacterium]
MLRILRTIVPTLLLVSVAAAQNPASPARPSGAVTPGSYTLEIAFGGGILEGLLTVPAAKDSATLVLMVGGHQSPVQQTKRLGNQLVLDSNTPSQKIHYELLFEGETVKGAFTFGENEGTLTGRRRAPGK